MFIREHVRMTKQQGHAVGMIYLMRAPFPGHTRMEKWVEGEVPVFQLSKWHLPKGIGFIAMWKKQYSGLYRAYIAQHGIPDVIHAHGYLAGMAARAISITYSVPYMITEHSTSIPGHNVEWYHTQELKKTYRDAKALIAVSSFLKNAMIQWVDSNKIHVISNPIDFDKFSQRQVSVPQKDKLLISIGSLIPRKGFRILLKACAALEGKDVKLKIIGKGPEQNFLHDLAAKLGLTNRVQWLEFQTPSEIAAQLCNADVYVSSSELETFGVTIVEALACGLPVVAAKSGAPEEYITPDVGKLVPANDVRAFTEAIHDILEHPEQFRPSAIRAYAKAKFDFPVVGARVDAVYADILSTT